MLIEALARLFFFAWALGLGFIWCRPCSENWWSSMELDQLSNRITYSLMPGINLIVAGEGWRRAFNGELFEAP